MSAKSSKTTPSFVDKQSQTGIFPGSGSTPYKTTLEHCTCIDFSRRKLPCKHIYRLAIELELLPDEAKSGINKNTLASSQISLADAVTETENLSDDSQLFIKNFPQTEPIFFRVEKNDEELLSCPVLVTTPLDSKTILEQMSKIEIMEMLKKAERIPPKNMKKMDLISWCIENIADIQSILPEIVLMSISPFAKKIWRKLYKYLRRKYDWEHGYIESEGKGLQEILIPAEASGTFSVSTTPQDGKTSHFFPNDEITDLLTLYGHNRCLNGFVVDTNTISSIEKSNQLSGKRFAVTGAFGTMTRADISAMVLNHGGRINEWVTKNTTYLLVGEAAGCKLREAKEKGVSLLNMQDFLALINGD